MNQELKLLQEALIVKLTRHSKSGKFTKDHYDRLQGQTGLSRRTLNRFFKEDKSIGAQSRDLLAAFYLDQLDEYKQSRDDGNQFFLEFLESLDISDDKSKKDNLPENSTYTDWLGHEKLEYMIYEVAFLWHNEEPPGIEAHRFLMSRKVEETKEMLHAAVNEGELPVTRQVLYPDGTGTRWISKADLQVFAKKLGQRPGFLFDQE